MSGNVLTEMKTHIRNFPASDLNLVAFAYVYEEHSAHSVSGFETCVEMEVRDQAAYSRYQQAGAVNGNSCNCDCCGHSLLYSCIVEHAPTGGFFHIGRDCFANVECLQQGAQWLSLTSDRAVARVAAGKKAAKERKAGDVREAKFFAERADLAPAFEFAKNPPVAESHPSYHKISYGVATLNDIRQRIRRKGALSDKQLALVGKLYSEALAKLDQDRERAQQVAAAVANGLRAPEGRVAVEGTVVSTKWVESDFGGAYKCLVDFGNGTRAYGTLPASADSAERGSKVSFTATFEVSAKDPLFAFYKRPSKWMAAPVGAGESALANPQKIAA
jgi:hypothetical protein